MGAAIGGDFGGAEDVPNPPPPFLLGALFLANVTRGVRGLVPRTARGLMVNPEHSVTWAKTATATLRVKIDEERFSIAMVALKFQKRCVDRFRIDNDLGLGSCFQ